VKVTFMVDCRDVDVPAGFDFEYEKICKQSQQDKYMVEVTVSNLEKRRTLGMNDKFHAMCGDLAHEASDGSRVTKNYIKETVKVLAVEIFGYPQQKDENDELVFTDEGRPVGISTASATSAQMTLLMDALRLMADQFGYDLERTYGWTR